MTDGSQLYFAYGSNLHPLRLRERVPSSRLVGVARLAGHVLRYHKLGACGSAKCNAYHTGHTADEVLGAVFEIASREKEALDRCEGDGYVTGSFRVAFDGSEREVFAYFATPDFIDDRLQPFEWYRTLVLLGAAYHGFPQSYIALLERRPGVFDANVERRAHHEALIDRLRRAPVDAVTDPG